MSSRQVDPGSIRLRLPHLVYVLSAWCYTITFEQAGGVMGKKSLGVGGRSGVYSADFARRGASRVVGIDFSNNMLKLAAKKAEQHQVTDRCTFIEVDAGWQVLLNALNVKD